MKLHRPIVIMPVATLFLFAIVSVAGAADSRADRPVKVAKEDAEFVREAATGGLGGVHRLWRLRRPVQERLGGAVRRRQAVAPGAAATGPAGARAARRAHGAANGRRGLWQLLE